jgi:hypothetical protein
LNRDAVDEQALCVQEKESSKDALSWDLRRARLKNLIERAGTIQHRSEGWKNEVHIPSPQENRASAAADLNPKPIRHLKGGQIRSEPRQARKFEGTTS